MFHRLIFALRQPSEQATKNKQAAVGLKSSFRYSQMSTGSGPGPGGGGDEGGGDGGGSQGASRGSWAQVLGSNLPSSWNKNVLEVVLEKDDRGAFIVSAVDCANMMRRLGIDQRQGVHVESVQICPTGRPVILITLKQNVDINRFCRYDVFDVTASGIRAVNVKPAGKRDVVVNIKGLHPNTRDDGVIDYLGKFGKIITNRVVYGVFGEGPLQGIQNGDRSYKMELKPNTNIGTYHVLDGHKVTLRYSGQHQTCARCHETARNCKGGAMAKKCELAGGLKVELSDYIIGLWNKIGYIPGEVEMAAVYDDHGEDVDTGNLQVGGQFTPTKTFSDPETFGGVSIRQFPKETDPGDIMEFLVESGLPESLKDTALIKPNGSVIIKNLDNAVCQVLIDKIHHKKHFGRKLFCNGIVPLTPEKTASSSSTTSANSSQQDSVANQFNSNFQFSLDPPNIEDEKLARRRSISASEILSANVFGSPKISSKDLNLHPDLPGERLSDFDSCRSAESDSSDDSEGYTRVGGDKPEKKRKAGISPLKEVLAKKLNVEN